MNILLAQAASLLFTFLHAVYRAALALPSALAAALVPGWRRQRSSGVRWYEGNVWHSRQAPKENSFRWVLLRRWSAAQDFVL